MKVNKFCANFLLISGRAYWEEDREAKEANNLLSWATAFEQENSHFIIEHSFDGSSFSSLHSVAGHGNNTLRQYYEFKHENPGKGIHYYRLKQLDYSDDFMYSDIISVTTTLNQKIKIFPNPTTGVVEVIGVEDNTILQVFDNLGKKVENVIITSSQIDLSDLLPGIYLVSIYLGKNRVTKKVVKK